MKPEGFIRKNANIALVLLLGATALYGALLILFFPAFHSDDYLVFTYIDSHRSMPVTLNPMTDFYLFFRPLSYFYFWVNYQLFGAHAILMKFTGLIIFVAMAYFVYRVLAIVNEEFELNARPALMAVAAFFFVTHPDMLHCVVWISNANELLMAFFYVLALYVFAKTKMKTASSIFLIGLLFLLSVLSKQQSLHFILFAGLYLLRISSSAIEKRHAQKVIAAGILFIIAYVLVNSHFAKPDTEFLSYAWKKPFSLVGTCMYILLPIGGERIYQFFVVHKTIAVIGGLAVFAAGLIGFIRSQRKKDVLWFLLLSLVIFFPRFLAHGGNRVNSIQILWFTIIVFYIVARSLRAKEILFACFLALLALNFGTSVYCETSYVKAHAFQERTDKELLSLMSGKTSDYLIVIADNTYLLDYSVSFVATGQFGVSGIKTAPFLVNNMLETSTVREGMPDVSCVVRGDEIQLATTTPHAYLSMDKLNPLFVSFKILETKESSVGRGYSYIRCAVSREMTSLQKIFFDGRQWKRL